MFSWRENNMCIFQHTFFIFSHLNVFIYFLGALRKTDFKQDLFSWKKIHSLRINLPVKGHFWTCWLYWGWTHPLTLVVYINPFDFGWRRVSKNRMGVSKYASRTHLLPTNKHRRTSKKYFLKLSILNLKMPIKKARFHLDWNVFIDTNN